MKVEKIENVSNPIVGDVYLVKCIKTKYRTSGIPNNAKWIPVIGTWHCEHNNSSIITAKHIRKRQNKKNEYYDLYHYHIDWRFMPEYVMKEQEKIHKQLKTFLKNQKK